MPLPFFYCEALTENDKQITLDEATSKHVVQVLRMQQNEQLKLTNGVGLIALTSITAAHKKNCLVTINSTEFVAAKPKRNGIAISPLKNSSRLEWFIEKVVELGIDNIQLLQCTRTEKQNTRLDRLQGIAISGMLQSQQAWLTQINVPIAFENFVQQANFTTKYIAHCEPSDAKNDFSKICEGSGIILIGPEGELQKPMGLLKLLWVIQG
jgi:16S rRNA (uracil1498-N3)-methyltransferase